MNAPRLYAARLSPDSELLLRELLGQELWQLHCPSLHVEGPVATTASLSVAMSRDRFVAITLEHNETHVTWLDYCQLRVQSLETPMHIERNKRGWLLNPSSVLFRPPFPNTAVSVLEFEDDDSLDETKETVIYDCGVILARSDGLRVCISADRSMEWLEVTTDPRRIAEVLSTSRVRESWTLDATTT